VECERVDCNEAVMLGSTIQEFRADITCNYQSGGYMVNTSSDNFE
jgi:hypothetical protein